MRFIVDRGVLRQAYSVKSSRITYHASPNTLIIGYGNPLRGDDGVGWAVVDALQDVDGITAVSTHQLLPEFIDLIVAADHVIFVDAAVYGKPGDICVEGISPSTVGMASSHAMEPVVLLAYADELYGRCPPAHLITITGQDFGYTETLSPLLASRVEGVKKSICEICHK